MEYYLMTVRSITQTQRMTQALEQGGIRCRWFRAPSALSSGGCGYVIALKQEDLSKALSLLEKNGLMPMKIYKKINDNYEEVSL